MTTTTITRDVIVDLWPLYTAGEASDDTTALVEAFLKKDPEFAATIRGDAAPEALVHPRHDPVSPDAEKRALDRTKGLLRARSALMGLAIFFTLLPMSSYGNDAGLRWMMLRDAPVAAGGAFVLAVACWVGYGGVRRRLRPAGL